MIHSLAPMGEATM